jgi:hypothetical protein
MCSSPFEQFRRRAGAGKTVAAKDAFPCPATDRLPDADLPLIALTDGGTSFGIYFNERESLKDVLGQQEIRVADAPRVDSRKIALQGCAQVIHKSV